MKFFRYRRPSLKTLLGITKAKKQLKKDLGITEALKPFRWWTNQKRRSNSPQATGSGQVVVQLRWLESYPPFDDNSRRLAVVRSLNHIPGVDCSESKANASIKLSHLTDSTALDSFLSLLTSLVTDLRSDTRETTPS